MNLFRKSNVLTAKTSTFGLLERFPVMEAKHCIPNWYKEMRSYYEVSPCPIKTIANLHGTAKNCYGIKSLINAGFIVQAWSDMSFLIQPNGDLLAKTAGEDKHFFEIHSSNDAPNFLKNKITVKLRCPWNLFGNKTRYIYTPAAYHSRLSQNIFMPSGVLEFEKQHAAHIFLCIDVRDHEYEIIIKAGEPLMHLIPLTDKKIILENKYESTFKESPDGNFYFCNSYNRARSHERKFKKTF